MSESRRSVLTGALVLLLVGSVGVSAVAAGGVTTAAPTPASHSTVQESSDTVSEEAYTEPVPDEGDPYFEAGADDGSWISYVNPRDEYRTPYLGDGSGKLCVTLVNEAGESIVGETVPNTTVTVATGEELEWHSHADPMTVEYPLTQHYDRPLDADQFGTESNLPQGDGYLDSHCIEMHGLTENATVEYGPAEIDGEHADRIELVGYVQQAHEAWDTDVDPIADARPYEEAGGWTYHPDGSHGQAVVVLQLEGGGANGDTSDDGISLGHDGIDSSSDFESDDAAETGQESETERERNESANDGIDPTPGFGVLAVVVSLLIVALTKRTV
ncbi:PGF-CTERM sorting domain-containing protein [Natrarchaeobius halalkaliphilus]|uniref:PGF-CTERM sorting domain-containing protein n=1 Tax=Natrarchaeobius halalkaliphilus TaxID=1679091 RepID=A0A3N6P4M4_9EURY|nr:PGF-CTERM sorting domain-containing protein [Natrarchaeobius halalkaliphilus]RQG90355.1 PGF-CTERM sorting domain-containing protein [Natrarchaeobius halalkaliphilus]